MKRTGQENFLDYIPVKNPEIEWKTNGENLAVLAMENKGFFNKAAQLIFKKPKVSYIELDEFGTFVWQQINGKQTVYVIGEQVKGQFGEKAEPLYTRLCTYIKTLRNHNFIHLERQMFYNV